MTKTKKRKGPVRQIDYRIWFLGISLLIIFLLPLFANLQRLFSSKAATDEVTIQVRIQGSYKDGQQQPVYIQLFSDEQANVRSYPYRITKIKEANIFETKLDVTNLDLSKKFSLMIKPKRGIAKLFCNLTQTGSSCQRSGLIFVKNSTYDLTFDTILLGDVPPQDGQVNAGDLSFIKSYIYKTYNENADLNNDNVVDSQDYSLALYSLGKNAKDDQIGWKIASPTPNPSVTYNPVYPTGKASCNQTCYSAGLNCQGGLTCFQITPGAGGDKCRNPSCPFKSDCQCVTATCNQACINVGNNCASGLSCYDSTNEDGTHLNGAVTDDSCRNDSCPQDATCTCIQQQTATTTATTPKPTKAAKKKTTTGSPSIAPTNTTTTNPTTTTGSCSDLDQKMAAYSLTYKNGSSEIPKTSKQVLDFSGSKGYSLPYRNTNCTVTQTNINTADKRMSTFYPSYYKESQLLTNWQIIQEKAKKYNFNPIFVIALWIEESAAGGATSATAFGCDNLRNADGTFTTLKGNHPDICTEMQCLFVVNTADPANFAKFACAYQWGSTTYHETTNLCDKDPSFTKALNFWYEILSQGQPDECQMKYCPNVSGC